MNYKLIALDLDGTLKNSKNKITPKTKEALIKAQQQGVKIVLASGRPTPGLRHEAAELELDQYEGYLLSFNGAHVSDYKTKETIYEQTLTIKEAKSAYDRAKEYGLACMTYEDDVVVTEDNEDEYVIVEGNINDIEVKKIESFKDNLKNPIHKVLLTGKPEYVASIVEEFKQPYGDSLSIYRSAPFFIEVMAQGIDKAASLDRLAKSLGIKQEEVMAFGDGYNDLSMIEYAGMGISMANGVDGVKERANFITLSNDEDGIAYALDKFLKGEE
ncbi:MAG: Cof-type HAD-IIB family hydrolase [Bacilli bacterium]|nr:Cof-type HAD-IIB family hydrolase [Bacilli bacterium]